MSLKIPYKYTPVLRPFSYPTTLPEPLKLFPNMSDLADNGKI